MATSPCVLDLNVLVCVLPRGRSEFWGDTRLQQQRAQLCGSREATYRIPEPALLVWRPVAWM